MRLRLLKYSAVIFTIILIFGFNGLYAKTQPLKGKAKTFYRSAQISMQQENYDKALGQYMNVIEFAPDHVESIKNVADINFMYADMAETDEEAREIYEKADVFYHRVLKVIAGIKDWQSYDNFDTIKSDSELKIKSIWVRFFNFAHEAFIEEDFELSEAILKRLIVLDPNREQPYILLANIADRKGDDEKKMEYYHKLLEIAKDNTQVIINIAIDYRDKKDWENAKKYFLMFIEAEPENVAGYLELAFVDIQMKDFKDAMEKYEKALTLEPNNADILINAGNVAMQLENIDKFIDLWKRVVVIEENVDNVSYLSYNLARYQRWQDLITYSKIWHKLDPTAKEPIQFIIHSANQLKDNALLREYQAILGKM